VARGWEKKIEERISNYILTVSNDDGVERKMSYKEYLDYEDYTGEDKMWLQYTGEAFVNIEPCNQIWVKKPEAPIVDEMALLKEQLRKMTEDFYKAEGELIKCQAENMELKATLEKKNKMIKALTEME
jgi:hypothetical protein